MTIADRPWIAVIALAYLGLVLGIGLLSARGTRGAQQFFVAGRSAGTVVIALATMAAAFSGFVFLGGPGLTYRDGLGSLWIIAPVGFTSGLLCWAVGRRLCDLARQHEIYTITDAVAWRFKSRTVTSLTALAIGTGSVAYLGVQLLALGVLLREIFGLESSALSLALGLILLLAYGTAGGMAAGLRTETVQGVVMLVAAVTVFGFAVHTTGGWTAMVESIAGSDRFGPAFLDPLARTPGIAAFSLVFVFGVGVLGQPHMLHKFLMLRDPSALRFLPLALGASQLVCLLVWIGVGLAVPALVASGKLPPLASPDAATPTFLLTRMPEPLAGLAIAAALAAIMSTANAFMNVGAAAFARDLPRALGRPFEREVARAKLAVVLVSLAAAAFAALGADLIAALGTFAFGTFAAALAPTLGVGLNWGRVPARAAAASIATGLIASLGLEAWSREARLPPLFAPGVPPVAAALALSFLALFAVTALSRPCDAGSAARRPVER